MFLDVTKRVERRWKSAEWTGKAAMLENNSVFADILCERVSEGTTPTFL